MYSYTVFILGATFLNSLAASTEKPVDCQDYIGLGSTTTGIYTIYPTGSSPEGFQVRCDMDTDGGGWTVFQRRISYSDFYKTWFEYQIGFGNLSENFWLGNQQVSMITAQGWYELRIDLENPDNQAAYAGYQLFKLGGWGTEYTLNITGYYGTAGDSLHYANGYRFSTYDKDLDNSTINNCADLFHGAWWYVDCHTSNLNGLYGSSAYGTGLNWLSFGGYNVSMVKTEMKVRRWFPHV